MNCDPEQSAIQLNRQAIQALAGRRTAEAAALLRQALEQDPQLFPAWMNLAVVQKLEGDTTGALASVDQALKRDPLAFPALLMRATLLEQMGKPRQAAAAYNIALGLVPPPERLDTATKDAIAHGMAFHARHVAMMEDALRHAVLVEPPRGASAENRRMTQFVDHLLGRRRPFRSEPTHYFYPGLPAVEFHDRGDFPWIDEVEAATPRIQAELAAVLEDQVASAELEPYMQRGDGEPVEQWSELNRSLRWSAYHFAFYGKAYDAHRAKCPFTASLLDRMPQPRIQNRSPAALFSILEPKTHIPAHTGVANFRLLCHLPLILPPDCRFRVGNSIRQWKIGEALIFDDTIEHEAWNESDQRRAVLIFDIWNPALSPVEQDFITRSLIALDEFQNQDPD